MSSGWIIFGELTLVFGVSAFFGIKEIRNLRRFNRERAERNAAAEVEKNR